MMRKQWIGYGVLLVVAALVVCAGIWGLGGIPSVYAQERDSIRAIGGSVLIDQGSSRVYAKIIAVGSERFVVVFGHSTGLAIQKLSEE